MASFRERLFAKAVRLPSGCLVWTGFTRKGYGRIIRDGRRVSTHRAVFELAHGPIPDGLQVCHTCDVRACMELTHLYAGTQQDNSDGWSERGVRNHPKGERNPNARLTEEKVREIRGRAGTNQYVLAREFGVSQGCIRQVLSRRTWKHVA